jgi:hypothetical protein
VKRIDSLEVAMTKGEILTGYRKLSPEERRPFDRWLRANAAVGLIFGLALVGFALAESRTGEIATVPKQTPTQHMISFQELHGLAHLENLPAHYIEDFTLVFTAPGPEARSVMLITDSAKR